LKDIELVDIINGTDIDDCKIHLASWNGSRHPLDVFVESKKKWQGWNEHRGAKNDFNKKYILSLIQFYPQSDMWLFGGLYHVIKRHSDRYEIKLTRDYEEYIGRLKVHYKRIGRGRSVLPDNHYPHMKVAELLRKQYSGEEFPGYEKINHRFDILEPIFKQEHTNWHTALKNVKGVYLITDQSNGRRYVGSAYGATGIWSRWACYIGTGHGHNDEFSKIIKKHGKKYAKDNFILSLLEYRPMKTDDSEIIERECFWKEVLLTRTQYGYNKN